MKKVLIIIDMQKDFIDGALSTKEGPATVDPVIREINSDYDYLVLTRDTHDEHYMETLEGKNLPVIHCLEGTEGWQIDERIMEAVERSAKPYQIFDKRRSFGCFEIPELIRSFGEEPESITLVGICTDICVISNALILRSSFGNTPMYYVEDACAATSVDNHQAALQIMNACQIYQKG